MLEDTSEKGTPTAAQSTATHDTQSNQPPATLYALGVYNQKAVLRDSLGINPCALGIE